ncbi:Uncharacterised protein [Vibrio cholerae]|uniref:Uncharacterized protein n=1 Tax=Vibrio cholerae TaxID=666 RepID=A0A655WDT6_VIBCL|nr:Uncharacterised protein [Vibrio cholerae]CSA71527.1 Uncharacterised protein [Vibrio cholerae]CSB40083.1 Uncharacterised protein [Vibrio cholerae]CSB45655.1 Uncharacterised protein [Vibrio cholerae]CSB52759.1 Uncharacterised protein [Vibrio cholerae]
MGKHAAAINIRHDDHRYIGFFGKAHIGDVILT